MVIRGVIRPPPDIRAVVDKTALFVSKNGRAFESRILNSDKGKTTKFAFLHGTSPFHAYYEERIRFYESGGKDGDDAAAEGGAAAGGGDTEAKKEAAGDGDGTAAAASKEEGKARAEGGDEEAGKDEKTGAETEPPPTTAAGSKSRTRKASVDPISRALLAERAELRRATAPPPQPPKDDGEKDGEGEDAAEPPAPTPTPVPLSTLAPPSLPFATMAAPSNATPAQLDVMRLTAQFACLTRVASGGKSSGATTNFLDELTLREWNNPTFAFLQPRHGHFAYFTALVDGYRRILYLATTTGKEEVGGEGDLDATVSGMMKKTELEDLRKSRQERELCRRPRNGARSTAIDAGRGEGAGLGGCLRAAARRAEYDRLRVEEEERKKSEAEGGGAAGDALGGVAAVDWHDFVVAETIDFAVDEEVQAPPPPPPPPPPRRPSAVPEGKEEGRTDSSKQAKEQEEEEDEDMDMDMDTDEEDEEEKIEIVSDYAPKIVSHASAAEDLTRTHMIDPITGKFVALADMSEHMRIQLLDPKWAEEKKRFMEKQKESNFVRGTDIAKNISRFAKQRGDIFGSSEAELLHQEEDSRKRLEEANRIIREQASLPQPQPESTPVATTAAAGSNKRPSEAGYPSAASTGALPAAPEAGAGAAPPAKKARPTTTAPPSMPPPPPPLATFPPAAAQPPPPPPPPATRSPPPPPSAASNAPPGESSDDTGTFAQRSNVPPPPPPPPPPSAQQPAKTSPPEPILTSAAVDAPGPNAAPPADEAAEEEAPAPPPAPFVPGVVHLSIKVPLAGPDDHQWTQWQFRGQTVSIEVDDAKTATIRSVKERLRPTLGNMPLNKMQLKGEGGFLRDGVKLADVVRGPTERMELVPKVRGGRK